MIPEKTWPERLTSNSDDRDAAFEELRYLLMKAVRSGLDSRPGADEGFIEDIVQVSLVRISDRIGSFKGQSAFTTWAISIALRVAFTELRRKHWGNVSLEELKQDNGFLEEEIETGPDPHQATARNSLFSFIKNLIQTELTSRQRDVLFAELKSMPQIEIANQLGISLNAVYKLAHDARRALKRALEEAGYSKDQLRDSF